VVALGSLAAFAATGRLPFGQGHMTEVAHRVVHEPPDLAGCPARLHTLIQACLEKQPEARPTPGRVLEFCLARVAELTGPGQLASQPRAAWGPTAGAPGHHTRSSGAATAVLPDLAQLVGGGPAGPAAAAARKRRLPLVAAGLAAGIVAAAVIVIAMTSHLAAGRSPASGANAARHPVSGAARAHRPAAASQAPAPVVLLSQGHPVTASSVQDNSLVAAYAVDSSLGTRWSSGWSDPQWLEVDLGATHTVTKVVLYWERAYATAFQIQVSGNGTTWTDVYSTTTGTGGVQALQVTGSGRYLRMYGTARATQYGYSLWEFQVFGS
jgi:hypothetical protein